MLLLILSMAASAFDTFYPFEVATGEYKTPAENLGAPWFQDNHGPAFGSDKNYYIKYNSTADWLAFLGGTFYFGGKVKLASNATTSVSTTLTASGTKNVYGINASGGDVSLHLPAASSAIGIPYFIGLSADPGSHHAIVNASPSKLGGSGGAATLRTTDAFAGLMLVSDGTNYLIVGSNGTWS